MFALKIPGKLLFKFPSLLDLVAFKTCFQKPYRTLNRLFCLICPNILYCMSQYSPHHFGFASSSLRYAFRCLSSDAACRILILRS
uniref:Uncharacterized protein n=1 Tax=Caenorhabditis japonica TaxID=281687 RepID=A0A8R1EVU6_CAEJA